MIAQRRPEISISLHFHKNVHNNLHEGQSAKINKNLQSVLKNLLIGESLVMIGQQGPEILSNL